LTIKESKRNWYNNQILTSNNKNKTIWKIIKTEPNKQNKSDHGICFFKENNDSMCHQELADSFHKNFLSIADKITLNFKNSNNTHKNSYLYYVSEYLKIHSQI
jgi:hypothetical protein